MSSEETAVARSVVQQARSRLETARALLGDYHNVPEKRAIGAMNAIVFGRMISICIQNMRGKVGGFDEWWAEQQERLKANKEAQLIYKMRNDIEKGRKIQSCMF